MLELLLDVSTFVGASQTWFSQNPVVGTIVLAALIALPTLYVLFFMDPSNAPPRFSYLTKALAGDFDMKNFGPLNLITAGYKQCGDCFRIRLFHSNVTFMIGPKAQEVFFTAKDSQLSQKEVYTFTVPVFGKNIVYDAPPKLMMQQLKFVQKGLNQINMAAHCAKIVKEAADYFASFPDEGEDCLYKILSELTILTASRCLLGNEIRENLHTEFADVYQDLSDGMSHLSFFWPHAPTKAHKKRDIARRKLGEIFGKVIQARRESGVQHDDYLQVLVDARYTDDSCPTNDEISGLLTATLFAGQHTSNVTGTWMGLNILKTKGMVERLLKEQDEVLKKYNGEITLDSLAEMELMHLCMKETLRLTPPLIVLMRKALEPVQYGDYVIPKGDIVAVSAPVGHRLPEVYADPERFDPDRFAEPRCEDQKQKFSYLAFGGGRHGCLGERFGYLQVKTIWSILIRQFEWELVDLPDRDFAAIVVGPKVPVRIKFKRKASWKAAGRDF